MIKEIRYVKNAYEMVCQVLCMVCLWSKRQKRPVRLSFMLLLWSKPGTNWQGKCCARCRFEFHCCLHQGQTKFPCFTRWRAPLITLEGCQPKTAICFSSKFIPKMKSYMVLVRERIPKYKTSNPCSVNQWLRSYYFQHVFLHF